MLQALQSDKALLSPPLIWIILTPNFLNRSTFSLTLRKYPFALFGAPFLGTMVLASWALGRLTQTRYDLRDERVHAMTKEEELGMKKGRRKFDVREEYYVSSLLALLLLVHIPAC